MLWDPGDGALEGCCTSLDQDLQCGREHETKDAWEFWTTDSVEYWFRADLNPVLDAMAHKVNVNACDPSSFYDCNFPDGSLGFHDDTFDVVKSVAATRSGTLNDGPGDAGFTIEWRAGLGFAPAPNQRVLCDLLVWDNLASGRALRDIAFSVGDFNDPNNWGVCKFACD